MPPSGRSSSSRSSSSRSSSRSSSSRSSSRSSSSRSYSSSSYRSSSSYVPSNANRIKSKTSQTAILFAQNYKKPIRKKPDFVSNSKTKFKFHHCLKHDYYYFDKDFTDDSGTLYKQGYYDETGQFYESLDLKYSETAVIEVVECEFCNTSQKIDFVNLQNGQNIICSNCGANLNIENIMGINIDYYVCNESNLFINQEYEEDKSYVQTSNINSSTGNIFAVIFSIFLLTIIPLIAIGGSSDYTYSSSSNSSTYYDYETFGRTLYVPEIDRTCFWDGDYYYDALTDCYFCFNDAVTPPNMQYWFEDFSSQYGDYGWLEYDYQEEQWYVETGENTWEVVENPESYFWYTSYDSLVKANLE